MSSGKPAHIKLRGSDLKSTDCAHDGPIPSAVEEELGDYEFGTPGERDGARVLLKHWEDSLGNFSEMARRSEWSAPHIRRVYDSYFEPAEEVDADAEAVQSISEVSKEDLSEAALEIYRKGYRDGFADGFEEARGHE